MGLKELAPRGQRSHLRSGALLDCHRLWARLHGFDLGVAIGGGGSSIKVVKAKKGAPELKRVLVHSGHKGV